MKITFLLTQSLEDPYGVGRFWPLAKELAALGHQITALALHPNCSALKSRSITRNGVFVRYVAPMHVWKRGNLKGYYASWRLPWIALRATWALTRGALSIESDVIHVGKAQPMNGLAGILAARWQQKPLYVDCDDWEAASNRFQNVFQRSIVGWCEDHLVHWAQGVTVNTRFLEHRLRDLGIPSSRITFVPNGVDRERFSQVHPRRIQDLREQLGLRERPVVAYIGSMSMANHPVDLLIQAFTYVAGKVTDAVLLLVGGGDSLEELQEQARALGLRESVRFVGRLAPDQVPDYMALADVTVDPVQDDDVARTRSPLKIFESLAVGTPVVTGDIGDRRFIMANGQAGMLVPPGDAQALAEGILVVLRDKDKRQSMREACLHLREQYYWDVLVRDFTRVYTR
jgi:glycosyltransferase involved in cell wall biosynthesis